MRCFYALSAVPLCLIVCTSIHIQPAHGSSTFRTFDDICNQTYYLYHLNDTRSGLVDQYGHPVSDISQAAGLDTAKCYEVCGSGYQDFNFQNFALSFTTWLLPWLALIAQLPYEAATPWANLTNLLIALGTPALITYSVTLTILNGYHFRQKFRSLWERSRLIRILRVVRFDDRVKAAALLVQESQQVPMRAGQGDDGNGNGEGWLAMLVVLAENQTWWNNVRNHMLNTRRGVTIPLVAQIAMAFFAWFLTALGASLGNLGDTTTALQLSSGSIWIWMIPVIIGWIMAGTQISARATERAITDPNHLATRVIDIPDATYGMTLLRDRQTGISNRSGFTSTPRVPRRAAHGHATNGNAGNPNPYRDVKCPNGAEVEMQSQPPNGHNDGDDDNANLPDPRRRQPPTWLSSSLAGDEAEPGPINNGYRHFTWWSFASTLETAFRHTVENLEAGRTVSTLPYDDMSATAASRRPSRALTLGEHELNVNEPALQGTSFQVAQFAGLDQRDRNLAYLPWSAIPAQACHHMFYASLVALWVQWGTTGASMMMAYLTPTVGLGCRSGAYLLYGANATFSWWLLLTSSLLSHAVMLAYQCHARPGFFTRNILAPLAIATRKTGKTLAVLNAMFLFTSCIFEYAGFYSRCWCDTDALRYGRGGYAVIFLTSSDLAAYSKKYWGGGMVFLISVTGITWSGFWLFCRDNWVGEN